MGVKCVFFKCCYPKVIFSLFGGAVGGASAYFYHQAQRKQGLRFFEPKKLKSTVDYLAPDTSEIRLLQTKQHAQNGDMAHCRLLPQRVSTAVRHKTVEEIWYCLEGTGEMWLKEASGKERIFVIEKDMALTIPAGSAFQFRNASDSEPLDIVITTMPPWPGHDEAEIVEGCWVPSAHDSQEMTYKK